MGSHGGRSQTPAVAEDNPELLTLPPPPAQCLDHRCVSPYQVYMVLGLPVRQASTLPIKLNPQPLSVVLEQHTELAHPHTIVLFTTAQSRRQPKQSRLCVQRNIIPVEMKKILRIQHG